MSYTLAPAARLCFDRNIGCLSAPALRCWLAHPDRGICPLLIEPAASEWYQEGWGLPPLEPKSA